MVFTMVHCWFTVGSLLVHCWFTMVLLHVAWLSGPAIERQRDLRARPSTWAGSRSGASSCWETRPHDRARESCTFAPRPQASEMDPAKAAKYRTSTKCCTTFFPDLNESFAGTTCPPPPI